MRLAFALLMAGTAVLCVPKPVSAAPLALSDHAAASKALAGTGAEPVSRRGTAKRATRRTAGNCGWQCKRYWRPYQYRYWKYYYPFGGPLFGAR